MSEPTERHIIEWRDEYGVWQLPGCTEAEATHDSHEAAVATIEAMAEDPEWADCDWRTRYEGPDGTITEVVR